jgi:hypothetical protein
VGLFNIETLDYTKLKDIVDSATGLVTRRRAQHVILFDPATSTPVTSLGATIPAIAQRHISGGFKTITATNTATPLSANDFLCQSVQITAIRLGWSDNTGRVGIGDSNGWYSALDPMGVQLIEAPPGGVLNLKDVFIYGNSIGDQVRFLALNTI